MLSDNQMASAHFSASADKANKLLREFAADMGVDVHQLASEGELDRMVDKLTAWGIRARRLKTGTD